MKKRFAAMILCVMLILGTIPLQAAERTGVPAGTQAAQDDTQEPGGEEGGGTGSGGEEDSGGSGEGEDGEDGNEPGGEEDDGESEEEKTPPTVRVVFGDEPAAVAGGRAYFRGERTAVVTVTDPGGVFDEEAAYAGIRIGAKDTGGEEMEPDADEMISEWTHEGDTHSADVTFAEDGEYTWSVSYTDEAGNPAEVVTEEAYAFAFIIDTAAPRISVSFDDGPPRRIAEDRGYFGNARTATVSIEDPARDFDPAAAEKEIRAGIRAADAQGAEISPDRTVTFGSWETAAGDTADADRHAIKIVFSGDANYTFAPSCTDRAGNQSAAADFGDAVTPEKFTVDQGRPSAYLRAEAAENWEKTWEKIPDRLTYGFLSRERIRVLAGGGDAVSPVETLQYIRTDAGRALTAEELRAVRDWQDFSEFSSKEDGQFCLYLKVTDYCGNVSYAGTDRLLIDSTKPRTEELAPRVAVSPPQSVNEIYSSDVKVDVTVSDPKAGGACSGLARVWCEVKNGGEVSQSEDLYVAEDGNDSGGRQEHPAKPAGEKVSADSEPRASWSGAFTVDSRKNNSNGVEVCVYVEDNAGNVSRRSIRLKIDITAPAAEVAYDSNAPADGRYYRESRTATITVWERNFRASDVQVDITGSEGTVPQLSEWKEIPGTGNGDDMRHVAEITYAEDGDYTFSMKCRDLAGNTAGETRFREGTATPESFTIDKTRPEIAVSYDNNNAENGRFFSGERRAKVTIRERNFDVGKVNFVQTASLDGKEIAAPSPVWSHEGDLHTAELTYDADGDYTFDVTVSDRAGNLCVPADYGDSAAPRAFTVDTGIGELSVTGVEDGASYRGTAAFGVRFADIHFQQKSLRLLRTRRDERDRDVTEEFVRELPGETENVYDLAGNISRMRENDGIYTLKADISDMAGNHQEETLIFTVNRFGSVYVLGDGLRTLRGSYVQRVKKDLVITEYNPDPLVNGKTDVQITRDTEPLRQVDYAVSSAVPSRPASGGSGWYRYDYVIRSGNFSEDGVYRISVSSEDRAGNHPETDSYRDCEVTFFVDTTPPVISNISGLERGEVNAESQQVDFEVFDAMGVKEVSAYVNGKKKAVKDTSDERSVFRGSLTLPEGERQTVRLVAEDFAGNTADTASDYFRPGFEYHDKVTVAADLPVRIYNRRYPAAGALCVAAGAAGAVLLFVRAKRRKRRSRK